MEIENADGEDHHLILVHQIIIDVVSTDQILCYCRSYSSLALNHLIVVNNTFGKINPFSKVLSVLHFKVSHHMFLPFI